MFRGRNQDVGATDDKRFVGKYESFWKDRDICISPLCFSLQDVKRLFFRSKNSSDRPPLPLEGQVGIANFVTNVPLQAPAVHKCCRALRTFVWLLFKMILFMLFLPRLSREGSLTNVTLVFADERIFWVASGPTVVFLQTVLI